MFANKPQTPIKCKRAKNISKPLNLSKKKGSENLTQR